MECPVNTIGEPIYEPISPTGSPMSEHDIFAEEVLDYLLHYFGVIMEVKGEYKFFTEAMGRSIIALSYTLRRKLWTFIQKMQINFSDTEEFEKSASHFKLVTDECYFYRFLLRISNIFELTMYSLKQGYNYIENASKIIAKDDSFEYFFGAHGAWMRLNDTAIFIATAGDYLNELIATENPRDNQLKSFVESVELLENPSYNASSIAGKAFLISLKKDILSKVGDIRYIDPRVLKIFSTMLCQPPSNVYIMSQEKLYNYGTEDRERCLDFVSEANMILMIYRLQLKMVLGDIDDGYDPYFSSIYLARYFATVRHLSDVAIAEEEKENLDDRVTSFSENNPYLLNTFYIVKYDYICSRIYGNSKYPQLSDSGTSTVSHLASARKVLDLNIDENNFFKINDGRFIVYTPDCTFDNNSIIVLVTLLYPWKRNEVRNQ